MAKKNDNTSAAQMMADIFKATFHASQPSDSWRPGIAAAFRDVGKALRDGVSPKEVAKVCYAAAAAIEEPERHDEVLQAASVDDD